MSLIYIIAHVYVSQETNSDHGPGVLLPVNSAWLRLRMRIFAQHYPGQLVAIRLLCPLLIFCSCSTQAYLRKHPHIIHAKGAVWFHSMNGVMLSTLIKLIRTTIETTRGNVKSAVSTPLFTLFVQTLILSAQLWTSLGIGHDDKPLTLAELAYTIYKDKVVVTGKCLVRLATLVSHGQDVS
jgi:hypothetical protein